MIYEILIIFFHPSLQFFIRIDSKSMFQISKVSRAVWMYMYFKTVKLYPKALREIHVALLSNPRNELFPPEGN